MRLFLYVPAYALAIAGLCVAVAPANAAGCSQLVGTADGWDKSDALSGSQAALAQEVNDFKKGKGPVTVTAMKARPQPYWRESVSDYLYVKPDVVTPSSYTVCWPLLVFALASLPYVAASCSLQWKRLRLAGPLPPNTVDASTPTRSS